MKTKHLIATSGLFFLMLFSACGSNRKEADDSDSIVPPTEENIVFTSPDLSWKDLTGNVEYYVQQSITEGNPHISTTDSVRFTPNGMISFILSASSYGGDKIEEIRTAFEYDDTGKLTNATDKAVFPMLVEIGRDEQNRIISYKRIDKNSGMDSESAFEEIYLWNENGRIQRYELHGFEWSNSKTFSYDAEGRILKCVERSSDMGTETASEESYEYISFDDKGNWTERIATIDRTVTEEMEHTVKEKLKRTEKRMIKYYK